MNQDDRQPQVDSPAPDDAQPVPEQRPVRMCGFDRGRLSDDGVVRVLRQID